MKYFIGAKENATGRVIVAEFVEADHFHEAVKQVERLAENLVGRGQFRVTAVNEQLSEVGSRKSEGGSDAGYSVHSASCPSEHGGACTCLAIHPLEESM